MGNWEYEVSRIIVERHVEKLKAALRTDVLVAGAGPSGMVAAYHLARAGLSVNIIERKLAPGGGIWGGGMERNVVVIQDQAKSVLDEIGIDCEPAGEGFFAVDSVLLASGLAFKCLQAGANIMNLITVEDVMIESHRLTGLVVNTTGVTLAKMHVDPLTLSSKICVDGTGHDAVLARMVENHGYKLQTETGKVVGQGPMQARSAEDFVVAKTGQVFPGLYLMGMAVAMTYGGPRMGPIFGGMLLSGKKVAGQILQELGK